MSTSWAIIIGINQYQGFQPLMQAQNDAVAVRKYLIEDAGFPSDHCILLSDLSTSIEQEAVYPDRTAISDWLETICQGRVQEDDTLWFFFSGYGAQENNRDYLMPVDGDPAQVKETGIALQDVVKYLHQAPTKDVMMVLDINRSMSALPGQAIGSHVAKLAQKARIPLMLSCQPDQFSHETLGVRHGIFTAALLEGLRYDGCATLSHLERYLTERVPELSEHHWRPIQNPVVILPEEQKFKLLWHQRDRLDSEAGTVPPPSIEAPDDGFDGDTTDDGSLIDPGAGAAAIGGGLILDDPDGDELTDDLMSDADSELILEDELPVEEARDPYSLEMDEADDDGGAANDYGSTLVDDLPDDPERSKGGIGGCLGALAALVAILLLGTVLFRNQPAVQNVLNQVPPSWLARLGLDGTGDADGDTASEGDAAAEDAAAGDTAAGDAATEETDTEETDTESTTGDADSTETATADAEEPETPDAPESSDDDAAGETPDNPDGNLDVDLDEVGLAVDDPDGETAEGASPGVAAVGNTTPGTESLDTTAILEEARRSLNPSQASQFASAIATAQKIPSDDPNYEAAQADIRRWSQVILDLAEGRAAETRLQAAIAAAELVPREPADIYDQAQGRIQFWQDRVKTRALIREAQAIPRMGQASTYQKGILKLQEVPANQPTEYADAKRLIGEWTEKMLMIAQARAAQGRYDSAIEAATLIPANTPNYDQAQAEIKRWQGQ